jgi:hypothetical protein
MTIRYRAIYPILLITGFAAALAGGCASEGSLGHKAAVLTGFGTESPKTKDFVVETRQPETRYVPVGTSITRPTPKLNEAAFRQMESGLDTRLSADKAAAEEAKKLGSTPPPAPPKVN